MSMTDKRDKDLNLVDGLYHDLAEQDAKSGKLSAKERAQLDQIKNATDDALKLARQRALEAAREERLAAGKASIPESILAMSREAIVERIRAFIERFPGRLAVQHRQLDDTPVEDLRSMLVDIQAIDTDR